ncbi:hypothetical protein ANCDUO_21589 [Ancylostoma duodenale]|uniref:Uncharacterized protein n=1 Tax=Ancylostoma duodenale TaxID=51022 RepID=A0A0C2BWJ2_9BILA|nr:hypothetical protein ANCDUO_21589 [Ancylostoma duodenale]
MNVTIGSEDGGSHRYRKNMVYKSLRRSSSQIMTNIKKKLSDAENSVRYRRALRPLNESRSPSPAHGQVRVVAPVHAIRGKNVYSTPKASSKVLAGYEFDHDSNILRTPNQSVTPPSVQIHRVKRKSTASPSSKEAPPEPRTVKAIPSRNFEQGGRFFIDLDKITEEWSNQVLFDVEVVLLLYAIALIEIKNLAKERNADWLESDRSDELARQGFEKLQYSVDDGFPEVLDLSAYYK